MEMNPELELAERIVVKTDANLFLSGRAGTGKTTFLHHLREACQKRFMVLAPTGVAAVNARGSTIHSVFQFPFSPYLPGKGFIGERIEHFRYSANKRKLLASIDLLIIDEISMVRPDVLDAIDGILRRFRRSVRPFGGVQLLMIGDLRQLAPVVRADEMSILKEFYPTPYFYESHALKESGFVSIELQKIYRQSDPGFIGLLNEVRDGCPSNSALALLNERFDSFQTKSVPDGSIRLTTHNSSASRVNDGRLAELVGDEIVFESEVSGVFPDYAYPVDYYLHLKKGAQVMFVRNDTGENRRYYNGMIATVVDLSAEKVTVRPVGSDIDISVEKAEWENLRYVVNEDDGSVEQVVDGVFRQYPLRLAWAITIHKSQGLTFDNAVIDASSSFAPGQVYVALSRCRSVEGLFLSSRIGRESILVDRSINGFMDECERFRPDEGEMCRLEKDYSRRCLADLFEFCETDRLLNGFLRTVDELVIPIYPDVKQLKNNCEVSFANDIVAVSERFVGRYASESVTCYFENELPEGLSDRIKNGCNYFVGELDKISEILLQIPLKIDNKIYTKKLKRSFDALIFSISFKRNLLSSMAVADFCASSYISARSKALVDAESGIRSSSEKKKRRKERAGKDCSGVKKEKKPKGYSIRITFDLYKEGRTLEEIAESRSLTLNTVAKHMAEVVKNGEIELNELVPEELIAEIGRIMTVTDPDMRKARFGDLKDVFPDYLITLVCNARTGAARADAE